MKWHSILIAVSIMLSPVADLYSVQRMQPKTLVSLSKVTKLESISSRASIALIACTAVANKGEWEMYNSLYRLVCVVLATNSISNGILWIIHKKRRAAYQLVSPLLLLSAISVNIMDYTCDDPTTCKCLTCVCARRLADIGFVGMVSRECFDGYTRFSNENNENEND